MAHAKQYVHRAYFTRNQITCDRQREQVVKQNVHGGQEMCPYLTVGLMHEQGKKKG